MLFLPLSQCDSEIFGHFGSAPFYLIIDKDSNVVSTIQNTHAEDKHGHCNPMRTLKDHDIRVIVASGIGQGAYNKFTNVGIKILHNISFKTVKEIMANLNSLQQFSLDKICDHHKHNHEHKHNCEHNHEH